MTTASNILVFKGDKDALKQQVISAGGLVVVDFHAPWCPSCTRLAKMLPEIAANFPNVLFLKADVDEATAREALRLAMHKLPIKCKFVVREDSVKEDGTNEG